MAKKRRIESWISRYVDNHTELEVFAITESEVTRNLPRIVEDIFNCRIEYQKYGRYLLIPAIFNSLNRYCNQKLCNANIILFTLNYTNGDIENDTLKIGTVNYINNRTDNTNMINSLSTTPFGFADIQNIQQGKSIITPQTRRDIIVCLQDAIIEQTKYSYLCNILNRIQYSQNIFELEWTIGELNNYIKAHKKINI